MARQADDGEVIKTLIESFQYPRKGPGMMWDAAARKTRAQGGAIHMGTRLDSTAATTRSRGCGRSRRARRRARR